MSTWLENNGGWRSGGTWTMTSRQTGKSMFNKLFNGPTAFITLNQAQADGSTWYTVLASYRVADWLRTFGPDQVIELKPSTAALTPLMTSFDIHETVYTLLALKYS